MYVKPRSAALLLVVFLLLSGLLAGCAGGDGGGSEDQRGGSGGDGAQEQTQDGAKKKAKDVKIAIGTIQFANHETGRFTVKPPRGEELVDLRLRPKAKITLNGQEAERQDIEKGQQAQVEYVVVENKQGEKVNRARSVTLFSGGGGETTGG